MAKPLLTIKPTTEGIRVRLYTKNIKIAPKQIGGHRFVGLLGESEFSNKFTLMLDFYGLKPFVENRLATIGKNYENKILDYVWGKDTYEKFEYEKYQGDMFPNVKGWNGLIDGLHKTENKIAEVKCYFYKRLEQAYYSVKQKKSVKKCPQKYWLQTRLYLYLLNKNDPNCGIKEAEIITFWIPNPDDIKLEDKYIHKFKVEHLDDGFDKLIDKALKAKQNILKLYQDSTGKIFHEVTVLYNDLTKKTIKDLQDQAKIKIKWLT